MKIWRATFLCVVWWGLSGTCAFAQMSFPMLMSTYPTGGSRGTTVEVTVSGETSYASASQVLIPNNFQGGFKVLFDGPGLTASVLLPPPSATEPRSEDAPVMKNIRLRVTIAPDAELGAHEFRIATPRGISTIGIFVVGDGPELNEVEPNNVAAMAQTITIPTTVNGRIDPYEDVDSFKLEAEAGQTLVFHVVGAKIEDKIHDLQVHGDPSLFISDVNGVELANNDDFFGADPFMTYTFRETGYYLVRLRDVRYYGNPHWVYRLTITDQPFLKNVFPMSVRRGANVEMELSGANIDGTKKAQLQIPSEMETGVQRLQVPIPGRGLSNPLHVFVSDLQQLYETPQSDRSQPVTSIQVPCVINGRIESQDEIDRFRFNAQKGQAFSFQVIARQCNSPLDSFCVVSDRDGHELAENDDSKLLGSLTTSDSTIQWTAPDDGEYQIAIRDVNNRGGKDFIYLIVCGTRQSKDIALRCDPDTAMMGPGGFAAVFVDLARLGGFAGDVRIVVEGLPQYVSTTALVIPPGVTRGVIFFQAKEDAPLDATNVKIVGIANVMRDNGALQEIRRSAIPMQPIHSAGGGRDLYPVNLMTVSVTRPQDLLLEIAPQQLTLAPGESAKIEVVIKRNHGFAKPVPVDMVIRHSGRIRADALPPGVTLESPRTIGENETRTTIVLKVAKDAPPIAHWPVPVMGEVAITYVARMRYSAPPLMLTIAHKK